MVLLPLIEICGNFTRKCDLLQAYCGVALRTADLGLDNPVKRSKNFD
jgi:hypothetical protein